MSFEIALERTLEIEKESSNHPLDPGKQTVWGVSRVYWPQWEGWLYVNKGLPVPGEIVTLFYRDNFWDRIQGDELASLHDPLATEVFDTAVNVSVRNSIMFLQEGLNLLNRNQKLYPDLVKDCFLGAITLDAIESCIAENRQNRLVKVLNHLQAEYYINIMRKNPEMEEFSGWFERT